MKKTDFYIKQKDNDTCIVFSNSLTAFILIQNICKDKNVRFFTYTPKNSKPRSLILKGLAGNVTTDEIKNEIIDLNIPNVKIIKISKINFNRKLNDVNHFLIQISPDSITRNLTSVRALVFQRVYWEPLKKKKLFQCTNCQRIGHASVNCSLGYRCVKCNENHKPGDCKIS